MNIPNESDWKHASNDLDGAWAKKHFFGKTHKEAAAMFVADASYFYEDLMYMPNSCFYFYIHDYVDYLMSDKSKGMSGDASCFYSIVEIRLEDIITGPDELKIRITDLLRRLAEKQSWYDADPEIYDSFEEKTAKYLKMIT